MRTLLLVLFLAGCEDDRSDQEMFSSPEGYRFVLVAPVTATPDLVGPWLDEQIAVWIAQRPGHHQVPRQYAYALVDHCAYRLSSGMWVAGWMTYGSREIGACIYGYRHATSESSALAGADAPHTVMEWRPGDWLYGVLVDPLPAIPHELDHTIGIHHARTASPQGPCPTCLTGL